MRHEEKTLSIVIPVYNEKNTILKVIEKVEKVQLPGIRKEFILVDDCSSDGSREILQGLAGRYRVVLHDANKGKGGALKSGFSQASGDFVIVQDADLELDPQDFPRLLQPLLDGTADVVFGTRFHEGNLGRLRYISNFWGVRTLSFASRMLNGLRLSDIYIGYKAFTREVIARILPHLKSDRFAIEVELTARIRRFRVREVPVAYYPRSYAEGKKIRWTDGIKGLWAIIRFNLSS